MIGAMTSDDDMMTDDTLYILVCVGLQFDVSRRLDASLWRGEDSILA